MEQKQVGITDEYGCFDISDFEPGDNIIVTNPRTRERIKGIVVSTNNRPASVVFEDKSGETHTVKLNNVTFLQAPERGWLYR